jgi:hypothetical protein
MFNCATCRDLKIYKLYMNDSFLITYSPWTFAGWQWRRESLQINNLWADWTQFPERISTLGLLKITNRRREIYKNRFISDLISFGLHFELWTAVKVRPCSTKPMVYISHCNETIPWNLSLWEVSSRRRHWGYWLLRFLRHIYIARDIM